MVIHLSGPPGGGLPEGRAGRAARAPVSTLLRVGFTEPAGSPRPLVRSYRTVSTLPVRRSAIGGLLSVALSCGSPRLAVSQHPALRSPDLPRLVPGRVSPMGTDRDHPADSPSSPWCHRITSARTGKISRPGDGGTAVWWPGGTLARPTGYRRGRACPTGPLLVARQCPGSPDGGVGMSSGGSIREGC